MKFSLFISVVVAVIAVVFVNHEIDSFQGELDYIGRNTLKCLLINADQLPRPSSCFLIHIIQEGVATNSML